MRKERQNFTYGELDSMQYENEANFKGQQKGRSENRGKRRSNRKRSSEGKVLGIGHRRQRKWSW